MIFKFRRIKINFPDNPYPRFLHVTIDNSYEDGLIIDGLRKFNGTIRELSIIIEDKIFNKNQTDYSFIANPDTLGEILDYFRGWNYLVGD